MVLAGYSGFSHHIQLASHELATFGINVMKSKIPKSNPQMIGYESVFFKQRIFVLECKMNGIVFQHGDSFPNSDCTEICKCNSGQLSQCSTLTLPPCPPQGCFSEEDYLQYANEFPGCPRPCRPCPPGKR